MPNIYIKQQCHNMIKSTEIFEQACTMAAMKDDGLISKDEKEAIKIIRKANKKFITALAKIVKPT